MGYDLLPRRYTEFSAGEVPRVEIIMLFGHLLVVLQPCGVPLWENESDSSKGMSGSVMLRNMECSIKKEAGRIPTYRSEGPVGVLLIYS